MIGFRSICPVLVGKGMGLMAAYLDDFNRADSSAVGASWNENVAGVEIAGGQLQFTSTGTYSSVVWTQPVAVSCQYQKATFIYNPSYSMVVGMLFRCSNSSNGSCYQLLFEYPTETVYWKSVANMTSPGTGVDIGQASFALDPGNTVGVTLELLGNNTIVRIWSNPTGLPIRANNWNGDTTPDVTMTQNPTTPRDAGTFLGLIGGPSNTESDVEADDWFGGGCLET